MSYTPQFTIRPRMLAQVEAVAALRQRIQQATIELSGIPALQKDTRTRNAIYPDAASVSPSPRFA